MGTEKWLDLALLVLLMVVGTVTTGMVLTETSVPIVGEIGDKSVIKSNNGNAFGDVVETGEDLLMSLVVVDKFAPYPKAIQINDTPVIRFTDSWLMQKNANISKVFESSGDWRLGQMLQWRVKEVKYVKDVSGDYIKYILEQP